MERRELASTPRPDRQERVGDPHRINVRFVTGTVASRQP
jgi:hypothetical protein